MSEQAWYYQHSGLTQGPFTAQQMKNLFITGAIARDIAVGVGDGHWIAFSASELSDDSGKEATSPPRQLDNFCAWSMVGVPITGTLLEVFSGWSMWWYYLTLYIFLYAADRQRLAEAGYTPLSAWNILLIPVYLWRRGTRVGDRRYYFYAWWGMFIASMYLVLSFAPPELNIGFDGA